VELRPDKTVSEVRTDFAYKLEMAKDEGRKVVGCLCSYFPRELVLAAGAIPVGLCGTTQEPIAAAEKVLPVDQCPMVKSTYGRAISNTCPIFPLADCIVGETTCDGRKKMYELLAREIPMHVMDLPQKPDEKEALEHWIAEVKKLKAFLNNQLNVEITDETLRSAIHDINKERMLMKEIFACRKHHPTPIMGADLVGLTTGMHYTTDREEYRANLATLLQELKRRIQDKQFACGPERPRVLWTGLGNSLGCDKVLRLVEECGGVVVCQEGCGGVTREDTLVDETKDPLEALAERYLKVTCACMTPNNIRFEQIDKLIRDYSIEGVLDLTWQSCHAFNIESHRVAEVVKGKHGLPFLHIVTDYSQSDIGPLRIRIEGFIEQMQLRRRNAANSSQRN
jgi:benzoyl-CoA reductase/2-hydroxyglutaryl-CoA dehydratase subunit BcrC/BadD/HgdB